MKRFKIGDFIVGTEDQRYIEGVIVDDRTNHNYDYCVRITKTNTDSPGIQNLHDCSFDGVIRLPNNDGWYVRDKNIELDKNKIVTNILKDL